MHPYSTECAISLAEKWTSVSPWLKAAADAEAAANAAAGAAFMQQKTAHEAEQTALGEQAATLAAQKQAGPGGY
jgi:hypothetical protein